MTDPGAGWWNRPWIRHTWLLFSSLVLVACEHDLGTPRGVDISGRVFYTGDAQLDLTMPQLMVALRSEDDEDAINNNRIASVLTDVPTQYPDDGLAFEMPFVSPGTYWLRATLRDAAQLRPPVADSRVLSCPFERYAELFTITDAPVKQRMLTLLDTGVLPPGCVTTGHDAGPGGAGDGSTENEEDPYAGFGITCVAGEDRAARGFGSDDCLPSAPICAALADQDVGFCTIARCDPDDATSCPPDWSCIDVSVFSAGAGYLCINLALI